MRDLAGRRRMGGERERSPTNRQQLSRLWQNRLERGIQGNALRVGRGAVESAYSQGTGLLDGGIDAAGNPGQQGGSKGRPFLRAGSYKFYAQDVGNDLAPDGAFGAAAGSAYLLDMQALLGDDGEAILEAEGHTFQYRADQVPAVMDGAQPDPAAARVGIEVRGTLALKVGQEEEAEAARRGICRFPS